MSAVTFDFIRFGPTLDNATEATPARNSVIDPDDIVEYQVVQNRSSVPNNDVIAVVAGHWIDPWDEPGAPGEREFNMEIANRLERRLKVCPHVYGCVHRERPAGQPANDMSYGVWRRRVVGVYCGQNEMRRL